MASLYFFEGGFRQTMNMASLPPNVQFVIAICVLLLIVAILSVIMLAAFAPAHVEALCDFVDAITRLLSRTPRPPRRRKKRRSSSPVRRTPPYPTSSPPTTQP